MEITSFEKKMPVATRYLLMYYWEAVKLHTWIKPVTMVNGFDTSAYLSRSKKHSGRCDGKSAQQTPATIIKQKNTINTQEKNLWFTKTIKT